MYMKKARVEMYGRWKRAIATVGRERERKKNVLDRITEELLEQKLAMIDPHSNDILFLT